MRDGKRNRGVAVLPPIVCCRSKGGSPWARSLLSQLFEDKLFPDGSEHTLGLLLVGNLDDRVDIDVVVAVIRVRMERESKDSLDDLSFPAKCSNLEEVRQNFDLPTLFTVTRANMEAGKKLFHFDVSAPG